MMSLSRVVGDSHLVKEPATCPSGWTDFNGRCFLYVPTEMTWAYAEKNCLSHGGNLASVHSTDEYQVIQIMISNFNDSYPLTWLGGTDAQQEGTWFWSDGSSFKFKYWSQSQPDNRGSAHCMLMNFGDERKFDDQPCSKMKPSVCSKISDNKQT
ncbi:Ladderlectin Precursor [Channa argus]|uniref:Ladderlectin n=2 Tax=Channa argus TaxID=215402 RepID=A0A6G1Q5F5_CHAAH|nr:Ladderlectin Precursor [Channa argus]